MTRWRASLLTDFATLFMAAQDRIPVNNWILTIPEQCHRHWDWHCRQRVQSTAFINQEGFCQLNVSKNLKTKSTAGQGLVAHDFRNILLCGMERIWIIGY